MELSEEAKELIQREIENESGELLSTVRELKLWLWVARVAFIVALGGSVYGYVKIDNYVDSKVIQRISLLDKLPIALAEANAEDFDQAISTMDELWIDIYEKEEEVSEDFEESFISNYVWILGSVVYSSDNDEDYWIWVRSQWDRLRKNQKFIKMKIDWTDNVDFQRSLALTELKFSPDKEKLTRAIKRISNAIEYENSSVEKSYLYYDLVLLYLINDEPQEAAKNLSKASELHPSEFLLSDWSAYKSSYLGDPEFEMWEFIGFEFNIFDLPKKLDEAFELALSLNKTMQPTAAASAD